MAKNKQLDKAKAKAARDKKLAIGGAVILVAVLAFEGPKTLKMLHGGAPASAAPAATTTTAAGSSTTPPTTTPGSLSAPTLGSAPIPGQTDTTSSSSSQLVSSVPVSADPGQLEQFQRFESKDPFAVQGPSSSSPSAPAHGGGSGGGSKPSGSGGGSKPPKTPPAPPTPPAPAPTSAVISVNGELGNVTVDTDFPTAGSVFERVGSLFHLRSLTASSAKVSVVGGSYASGSSVLTLKVGVPVTLQNTADGTQYTLVLEKQGTALPSAGAAAPTAGGASPPTSVVPSGSGSGG